MVRLTWKQEQVIRAYADADMRVPQAAVMLGMHPDTVRYHLETIKTKTELNPKKFWELCKLLGLV